METPPKNMMCGTDGPYLLPSTALISAAPPKLVPRVRLEEGGSDPLHGAVFKAAQEIGYSITVHESCVVYGYKGTIDYVKVPIGFPFLVPMGTATAFIHIQSCRWGPRENVAVPLPDI